MGCVRGVKAGERHQLSHTCQSGAQKAICIEGQSQSLARQESRQADTGWLSDDKVQRLSPEGKMAPASPWYGSVKRENSYDHGWRATTWHLRTWAVVCGVAGTGREALRMLPAQKAALGTRAGERTGRLWVMPRSTGREVQV